MVHHHKPCPTPSREAHRHRAQWGNSTPGMSECIIGEGIQNCISRSKVSVEGVFPFSGWHLV